MTLPIYIIVENHRLQVKRMKEPISEIKFAGALAGLAAMHTGWPRNSLVYHASHIQFRSWKPCRRRPFGTWPTDSQCLFWFSSLLRVMMTCFKIHRKDFSRRTTLGTSIEYQCKKLIDDRWHRPRLMLCATPKAFCFRDTNKIRRWNERRLPALTR